MQRNLGVPHFLGNVRQRPPDNLLVGPAHPVRHRHRRIGRVSRFPQLIGNAEHPRYAEENHQRAAMTGQVNQLLALRHRHPPLRARHYHRLRYFGNGKLRFEDGSRGKSGAHAGNNRVIYALPLQYPHLLQRRPVQRRIAALNPRHRPARRRRPQRNIHNLGQRHLLAAVHLRARLGKPGNLLRHQRVRVDNHIGPLNYPLGLQRQQLRIPRPRANDINLAGTPLAGILHTGTRHSNCSFLSVVSAVVIEHRPESQ